MPGSKQPDFQRLWLFVRRGKSPFFCNILITIICCFVALPEYALADNAFAKEPEKVHLQLKWHHQFQFAGFYAALEKGFYQEEGLDVTIIEGSAGIDFIETVVSGEAEYGVEMPDLLLRRAEGAPVVVLACIFQHSAIALVSLAESHIYTPHDLIGRKIMLRPSSNADVRAMIAHEGIAPDAIKITDHSFDVEDLIEGKTDAMSLYSSAYGSELKKRGIRFNLLHPVSYGVDFYGDCLFTSETEIEEHPDRVIAFRAASLRGWEYAMNNPLEISHLIHERYAPEKPIEVLLTEADQMNHLLLHKVIEIGHINPGRWKHIGDTFVSQGMLEEGYSLEGFIYEPPHSLRHRWTFALVGILIGIILVSTVAWLWTMALRRLVKQRTAELEETNKKHQRLVDNLIGSFLYRHGVDGVMTYVSSSILQVLGYSPKEFCAHFSTFFTDHPINLEVEKHTELSISGIQQPAYESQVFHKNGSERWLEIAEVSVRDENGRVVAVEGVAHDITERKHLEVQFRQAQKMEAVGQLAGGVAHDFNNLLHVILGYGELVIESSDPDNQHYHGVAEMIKAGERAKTLVRQLLAFSRRQVLELEDLDLREVIRDLSSMITRVIGEHIALDILSKPGPMTVRADKGQIEQILMNLCVNARDAMPQGGKITIEIAYRELDEQYCRADTWVEPGRFVAFSISDTGCGMDEETKKRVFEPFFTTKEVGKGTGLGVSTAYGIVRQHKGTIDVSSEVGKGTTFSVNLPLVEPTSSHPALVEDESFPGGIETILLAEDDEAVRDVCRQMLEAAGYTVLIAENGEQAKELFDEHSNEIDIAVLDVVMPKTGGREVFDYIRVRRDTLPVIFASGYSADAIHTGFILNEGMTLIQKPYNRHELLRRIRDMLDTPKLLM